MEYLQNLEREYKDICDKKGALSYFLEYGNHDNLNEGEEGLLRVQYAAMNSAEKPAQLALVVVRVLHVWCRALGSAVNGKGSHAPA